MDTFEQGSENYGEQEEKKFFCTNCGTPINCASKFCSGCGRPLHSPVPSHPQKEAPVNVNAVIGKVLCLISGVFATFYSILTIEEDTSNWWYTYSGSFTDHETFIVLLLIAGIVLTIIGCCIPIHKK